MNVAELTYAQLADRLDKVDAYDDGDGMWTIDDEDRAVMTRAANIIRVADFGPAVEGLADFIVETRKQIAEANLARVDALNLVAEKKRREYAVRQRNDYLVGEMSKMRLQISQVYTTNALPAALYEALRDHFTEVSDG